MTFIIAELGINCNGSLEIAKKLIDAAKWAGADAVKFQKRTVDLVYAGQLDQPRESPWGKTNGDQKRALEFSRADYDAIDLYCASIGMSWFASAWDIPSLEFLSKYNLPYNKVASAMVTNIDFLMAVGKEGKPTFLSTGLCSDLHAVDNALSLLKVGCRDVTVMHCVGTYPCPESDLNLRMINVLQERYACKIGYSGHEASVSPSVIAVALGATAVERHITLDRTMYGSDQAASLEPKGLREMVDMIRKIPTVLGDGVKRLTSGEEAVAKKLRYWDSK